MLQLFGFGALVLPLSFSCSLLLGCDKNVHQIARNFRDRWIPRYLRKNSCAERDDGRMEFHHGSNCNRVLVSHHQWCAQGVRATEAIECVNQSVHATTVADVDLSASHVSGLVTNGTKNRKRKSQWDQSVAVSLDSRSHHKEPRIPQNETNMTDNGSQNIDDDVPPGFDFPPGFSLPLHGSLVPSNAASSTTDYHQEKVQGPCEVVIGQPKERFISHMLISYGIPMSVAQQFGVPQTETAESWIVAPAMPFLPFPPLPPYPRDKRDPSPCATTNPVTRSQPAEIHTLGIHNPPVYHSTPSTSGAGPPYVETPTTINQHNFQLGRGSCYSLERECFRQPNWNNTNLPPPWIRNRNGWGFTGNNPKYETGVGTTANEFGGPYW
ncbi:unnamed protein product [Ilex paraguariensis]|uniref:Secreted protein n=1 Tax=Ilex paraguariensis TaxID=185542 RepID=A0ABC8TA13_9AQUA